jgi:hypothetical protein
VSETRWNTAFNIGSLYCTNCAARLTSWFIAPSTGNYTFTATGDDQWEFWISADESLVVRRQELPPNSSQVLDITPYNSKRCATGYYYYTGSCVRTLQAGSKYWIRGWVKQGSGGFAYSVAATGPNGDAVVLADDNLAFSEEWVPSVELVVRNVPAKLADKCLEWGSCAFNYAASATPTVTSVTGTATPGSVITIGGLGFDTTAQKPASVSQCIASSSCGGGGCNCANAAECANFDDLCTWDTINGKCAFITAPACDTWSRNRVTVGGAECQVTSQSATQLQCRIGYTAGAGSFPVLVNVLGLGVAAGSPLITLTATIRKLSPAAGSINGGNVLTVLGYGFDSEDQVTTVTVGGTDCPILTINSFQITCTVPAIAAGNAAVAVQTKQRTAFTAASSFTYATPFVRPGVNVLPGAPQVSPRRASLGGGSMLTINVPALDIVATSTVAVTFAGIPCDINFALGHLVKCRTRGVSAPRAAEGRINVTQTDGSWTALDLPAINYVRSITAVDHPGASVEGSTLVEIDYDGFQVAQKDVSVAVFGAPCVETRYGANSVFCLVGKKPTTTPTLPVLESYNLVQDPSSFTNPLARFDYSTGVTADVLEGSALIPAGANWLMTKSQFARPFVFKAKVRATRDLTPTGGAASVVMRVCVTENAMSNDGYRAIVASRTDGRFAIAGQFFTSLTVNSQYAANTPFVNVGLDSTAYHNYRVEAHRRYIRFYIDDVLIQTVDDATEQIGSVGFGFSSQAIRVKDLVVEDLYAQSLQVNISGVPVSSTSDVVWVDGPKITRYSPKTITVGSVLTITGTDFGAYPYEVYSLNSASDDITSSTPRVCSGSVSYTSTGTAYVTCPVGAVPNGNLILGYRSGSGKASYVATDVTYQAYVSSVTPASGGSNGKLISIVGGGFASGSTVTVGGSACAVQSVRSNVIICAAPAGSGNANVAVTSNGQSASVCGSCSFNYNESTPVVVAATPTTGAEGTVITFTGTGFETTGDVWVRLGSVGCSVWSRTATQLVCAVGRATSTGSQTGVLHFAKGGFAQFGTPFSFNFVSNVRGFSPTTGSLNGGQTLRVDGSLLDLTTGTTLAAGFTFDSTVESGWTNAPASLYTCNAISSLGPLFDKPVTKSFTSLPAHAGVRVVFDLLKVSSEVDLLIDGVRYSIPSTSCYSGWVCGDSWTQTCRATGSVVVPHTGASVKVSFVGSSTGTPYGIISYAVQTVASIAQVVTINGNACEFKMADPSAIWCRTPAGSEGQQTLTVTVAGQSMCTNCKFTYAALSTPTVTAAAAAEFAGLPANSTLIPQIATTNFVLVSYSENGATVTRSSNAGSGWNGLASSPLPINEPSSGIDGIAFTARGLCHQMHGLSTTKLDESGSYTSIDFAVYLTADANVYIYERGVNKGAVSTYMAGDAFAVYFDATTRTIKYAKNSVLIYNSEATATFPLYQAGSLNDATCAGVEHLQYLQPRPALRRIVFKGTALTASADSTVSIAGAPCAASYVSGGVATCWTAALPTASFDVVATGANGVGSSASVSLTARTVSAPDFASGSTQGGHELTLAGSGFEATTTVSIGSPCLVKSYTATSITCVTGNTPAGVQNVVVSTNGNAHVCFPSMGIVGSSLTACQYTYQSTSAKVTSVAGSTSSGQTITVSGANIQATGKVFLDDYPCTTVTLTTTRIVCRLGNIPAGTYTVKIIDRFIGSSQSNQQAQVQLTVTSTSTTSIGNLGSARIVISGANFGTAEQGGTFSLLLADSTNVCASITRTPTMIICVTNAFDASNTDLRLTVNTRSRTLSSTFSSAASAVPTVTSVLPTSGGAGSAITVSGTNLDGPGSILIGGEECPIISSTSTTATCIVTKGTASGNQQVTVRTDNKGTGTGSATFNVRLMVLKITPGRGVNAGNQVVTVVGSGFSTDIAKMRVRIAGATCAVLTSTAAQLTCRTGAVANDNSRTELTVAVVEPTADNTTSPTQYAFSNSLTATIASISPATGSAAGMETLTITGTGFSTDATQNVVRIGGTICPVQETAADGTWIKCFTDVMAINAAAAVDVIVNGQGRASQPSTPVTFGSNFNIASVAAAAYSVEGGATVTFIGAGFWTFASGDWQSSYYQLTVGGQSCTVESATSTEIRCTLPPVKRPFVKLAPLVNQYPLKPEASNVAVALTANGKTAIVAGGVSVSYTLAQTPRVDSVSPRGTVAPNTQVTITGTGFASSGNKVYIGKTLCPVQSESSTVVVCRPSILGQGFLRVLVPGKGFTTSQLGCPVGQSLMCDGSCVDDSKCVYEEWGMRTCADLSNLIIGESFCHANGGTDRVGIPFKTDSGTVFNLNCPMYSCEGGDCDQSISIGGRGGRISTCGPDPAGFVVDVRPTVSALSATSSSIGGGKIITVTGTSFGANVSSVVVTANNAVCVVSSLTDTQIVCETSAQVRSTSQLVVYVGGISATCSVCTFMYVDDAIPVITATSPTNPRFNQALTITGTNFGTDATNTRVYLGSRLCAIVSVTATSIVCTAPQNRVGTYSLRVITPTIGSSFGTTVKYNLYVQSLSAVKGSTEGGHVITVTGTGFSDQATVSFGGCQGTVQSFTNDRLVVSTPACLSAATVVVTDAQSSSTCSGACTYTFAALSTIGITSSSVTGTAVSLTLSNLNGAAQENVTVWAGGAQCAVTSLAGSILSCTMGEYHAGTYKLRVLDRNQGYGPVPPVSGSQPSFTFATSIASISPTSGSRGGGQRVTITGTGFGNSVSGVSVKIGSVECPVQSVNNLEIVCLTPQTTVTGAQSVTVTSIDAQMLDTTAPVATAGSQFTFNVNSPTITSVVPNRGSTAGGTSLTIGGTNLVGITLTIDGVACAQSVAQQSTSTASLFFCTTAAHATLLEAVRVKATLAGGLGEAYTTSTYQYIDLWSRWTTWGNTPPPVEGDSAVISEGQSVMIDYSPPRFFLIIVMGHLLFDNEVDINLDCTYIMINYGRFTVGTPERPYLKKAVITLHGDRLTPEIPVHGAKVIALRNGALDMHGQVRQPTWTKLAGTASAGSSTITVKGPVDWKVGEFIVVAPTNYEFLEAEHRMITGVTPADGQAASVTLQLEYPLEFLHYGQRQCFGPNSDICVDEIAEVGLLTRNIVVRGDKNSMRLGFGGTMFLMPLGQTQDRYARLSYVEFAQVGQQFIVGRYPVHYHVTYQANTSYVNGTSVHESMNRAFSIHGVANNTYVNNVAYDIMGHAFFIEDGSERFNTIHNNMVSVVKSSTSNLNTDVTPANFWIVSPSNIVTNNAACGGHSYGFWISPFHPHSTGPTSSEKDCPYHHQLTNFSNNVAHSNRKYGLNIFQYWYPKAVECDANSADVTAYIRNHVSYKNQIHGITMGNQEVGEVGSVIVDGYTGADNGFEHADGAAYWIEHNKARNQSVGLQNSNLIALTNNNPFRRSINRRGVNLPLGDNFFTENVTFVNYNGENHGFEPQAWAERMSLCFPWGWDAVSRGLKWVDSPNRVNFRFHHHGVLADDDGTLTGVAGSQALAKSPIFDDTICETRNTGFMSQALVCPNAYKIRRFGISTMNEIWTWQMWKNGPRQEEVPEILRQYLMTAPINHSIQIDFQWWKNPALFDWRFGAFIFIKPGEHQLFWTIYNETRHHVYGKFNTKEQNKTWTGPTPTLAETVSRYNWVNETQTFTGHLVYPDATAMSVIAHNCPDEGCPLPPLPPAAWDKPCRSFTAASSWSSSKVPSFEDELFITTNDAVCMDGLPNTAVTSRQSSTTGTAGQPVNFGGVCTAGRVYEYRFFNIRIEGSLQLLNHHCPCDGAVVHLKVLSTVWIRNGGLLVGNESSPLSRCTFRLSIMEPPFGDVAKMGKYQLQPWGPRNVVVESGMLRLIGTTPRPLWARLRATAAAGSTTLQMDQAVSWTAGQTIAIAGTTRATMYYEARKTDASDFEQSEKATIASVSPDGFTVTLQAALKFEHYGSTPKVLGNKTFDIGAEVIIFDRKIMLDGGADDRTENKYAAGWQLNIGCTEANYEGCAVGLAGEVGWPMGIGKPGYLNVDGVLFRDVGQAALQHGAIDLDGLTDQVDAGSSFFRNNAFDRIFNTGIFIRDTTTGMNITNNVFFNVSGDAIRVASPGNNIDGNVIIRLNMPVQVCDFVYFIFWDCRTAGVRAHSGNRVANNVVASGPTAGYITEGDQCDGSSMRWSNNYVHSTRDGMLVADHPAESFFMWKDDATVPTDCRAVGGVTAYWIGDHGLMNWYAHGDFIVSDMTVVEATVGISATLMYPPANVVGMTIPRATYTNLRLAGYWDRPTGAGCRSAAHYWTCKKSLLDSMPWCSLFHLGHNQQPMGVVGISETVFTSSEFGMSRTKGEQKFRWLEVDSYSTIGGQAKYSGIHFANFDGNDACGLKNVAFHQNPYSNDTFHHHTFEGVTWGGYIEDGGEFFARRTYGDAFHMADQFTPSWYLDYDNFKFGAYWPDAPNHVLVHDLDGSFTKTGKRTSILASESITRETVFADLKYDGRMFAAGKLPVARPGCTEKTAWKAFSCDDRFQWLSLIIDNLSEDRLTRRPGPVVICKGSGMQDVNGYPLCEGGQVDYSSGPVMKGKEARATLDRMTRYWFHAENGKNHTISFRGQPPTWMRMYVQDHEYLKLGNNVGVTLNLRYFGLNSALRVGVYVNGVRQRPVVGYNYPALQTPAMSWPAPTDPAGTHYHDKYVNAQEYTSTGSQGVQRNVLSFVVRPGSYVDLKQEPIVQVTATLSMPLDEFFNQKDTFVAVMAATLGIDESRIKFAKIVAGTTRRRAGATMTDLQLGIDQRADQAQANFASGATAGTEVNDLNSVASGVNARANSSDPIPGFRVMSLSATVVQVAIPVPPINIARGTPYVQMNLTRANSTVNTTVVRGLIASYARVQMNLTVDKAFQATTDDEIAMTNVYVDTAAGTTRAVLLMLYENGTQSYVGLEHVFGKLSNATTSGEILPGYTITSIQFYKNGYGEGSSGGDSDMWSVEGSVLKFAIGIAAGLVAVFLIGGGLLYYCLYRRTAKLAEAEAKKAAGEEEDGPSKSTAEHSESREPKV